MKGPLHFLTYHGQQLWKYHVFSGVRASRRKKKRESSPLHIVHLFISKKLAEPGQGAAAGLMPVSSGFLYVHLCVQTNHTGLYNKQHAWQVTLGIGLLVIYKTCGIRGRFYGQSRCLPCPPPSPPNKKQSEFCPTHSGLVCLGKACQIWTGGGGRTDAGFEWFPLNILVCNEALSSGNIVFYEGTYKWFLKIFMWNPSNT